MLVTKDAALYISASIQTLKRMVKRGEIPAYRRSGWKSYRFMKSDLDAWIAAGLVETKEKEADTE